jgi:tripartite-type tricarboxylate transporter receptor subunit TctC
MSINRRAALCTVATLAMATRTTAALAQQQESWPHKPIRLVVPYAAGGTTDILARTLAAELQRMFGQPIVVDNVPGAGGSAGAAEVAKAPADGYTFLMGTAGTHAINASMLAKPGYDPVKDFTPVTMVAGVPSVVVMNNVAADNYGIATMADLVRVVKANPAKLTMGSSGNGTSVHLAGELFKATTNSFMVHIAYQNNRLALSNLMGGETDIMFDDLPSSLPHIRAGKLKALAVTSAKRATGLPQLQTIAECGLPELKGFEASSWFGLLAPAGTPADIVEYVQKATALALIAPRMKERLLWQGAELSGSTSAEFAAHIKAELLKWAEIVRRSGARVD